MPLCFKANITGHYNLLTDLSFKIYSSFITCLRLQFCCPTAVEGKQYNNKQMKQKKQKKNVKSNKNT